MCFLDRYTEEEIAKYIAESVNFAEVLNKMGQSSNSGSNRMLISLYSKEHNIKTEHFYGKNNVRNAKDVFVENSNATQSTLRRYYKRGDYSEYKCAICGLPPFWNGQELTLTLDHINGKNNDNRLENLRWVCPNCDRQLPTYGTKRKKRHTYCKQCGIEIAHSNKTSLCKKCYKNELYSKNNHTCLICGTLVSKEATYCISCFHKTSRKASRPEPLELAKMIVEQGFEATGKYFGVSGKAISKWCKASDIPTNKKDLVNWYNTQMGIDAESKKPKTSIMPIAEVIHPVNQIDMKTNEIINTFANISEAGRHLGKSNGTHIGEVCNGKRKSAYGYYWEFA